MPTPTTRLGLSKPAGAESLDVSIMDSNFDILDANIGVILVNAGVTPPNASLYDGAVVKEKTTGITWIAQKNGGGGFDKAYINYPLFFQGADATVAASGTQYNGSLTFQNGVNCTAAAVVAGLFVVPVAGYYDISMIVVFGAGNTATGYRAIDVLVNAAVSTYECVTPGSGTVQGLPFTFKAHFNAGDTITTRFKHTAGVSVNVNSTLRTTLAIPDAH